MIRLAGFIKFDSKEDWESSLQIRESPPLSTYGVGVGVLHHDGDLSPESFPQFYKLSDDSFYSDYEMDWYKCSKKEMAESIQTEIKELQEILQKVLDK